MLFPNVHAAVISDGWTALILAFAFAAVAGLSVGLLYRVGAAILLTGVTAVAGFLLGSNHGFNFWQALLYAIGLMTVLQMGYLVGVAFSGKLSRATTKLSLRSLIAGLFKQNPAP